MLSSFAIPEQQLKSMDINNNIDKKKYNNKSQRNKQIDENVSVHELTDLIGRLTAQLEKLETSKVERNLSPNNNEQRQQHPQQQSNNNNNSNNSNSNNKKRVVVNPLAADVTQSYEKLLRQDEYLQQSIVGHPCSCCSCAINTVGTSELPIVDEDIAEVEVAPGIPWFSPYIPSSSSLINSSSANSNNALSNNDPLHSAYVHWCTLMRCLPSMDPGAQYYIRTIGHYAMRQLLHSMRNHNNDHNITAFNSGSATSRIYNSNNNINNSSRTSSTMLTTNPSSPRPPPVSSIQR